MRLWHLGAGDPVAHASEVAERSVDSAVGASMSSSSEAAMPTSALAERSHRVARLVAEQSQSIDDLLELAFSSDFHTIFESTDRPA